MDGSRSWLVLGVGQVLAGAVHKSGRRNVLNRRHTVAPGCRGDSFRLGPLGDSQTRKSTHSFGLLFEFRVEPSISS